MKMLEEIGSVDKAADYVEDAVATKKKIMGFGHRVYKAKDPRAVILEEMSRELGTRADNTQWFDITHAVEQSFQPKVVEKGLFPNVRFLQRLGLSGDGHPALSVHADLRLFARRRLDGALAGAIRQQPAVSPVERLHRRNRAQIHADWLRRS